MAAAAGFRKREIGSDQPLVTEIFSTSVSIGIQVADNVGVVNHDSLGLAVVQDCNNFAGIRRLNLNATKRSV